VKGFNDPIICMISSGGVSTASYARSKHSFLQNVRAAVEAKISLVQIREKSLSARLVFELAREAGGITSGTKTRLIVNERADIAISAGADGVHLPSRSLTPSAVRSFAPPEFVIGVSAHSLDDVLNARSEGADYAVFGPVFDTPGKGPPVGLEELGRVAEAAGDFPVLALGGIDGSNYPEVLASGVSGFAAIRYLNSPENLRRSAREIGLS
jgi:thiamine-phosphate pyrophosphorylase